MKKNDKRKIRIWKKTFALALSSVMIFSCIPMTQVKAGDESPEAIINGLVDLPKTFIDKDSQDLGSDRVFYRNTNTDLSMLPAECYKKALQSYIIDDDVPMGTRKGRLSAVRLGLSWMDLICRKRAGKLWLSE